MSETLEFVLNLKDGENVIKKIKEFAEENNIVNGVFVAGSGSIRDFELSGFRGEGRIENRFIKYPYEVLAVSGRIFKKADKYYPEMKVSLTRSGASSMSGLLLEGIVEEDLKISIRKFDYSKMIIS